MWNYFPPPNPNPSPNPNPIPRKVDEQVQMTSDTMIKGESTVFSVCSQPLSIMLMYLNPNPNPNVILTFGLGQSNVNLLCVYMGMWNYFPP